MGDPFTLTNCLNRSTAQWGGGSVMVALAAKGVYVGTSPWKYEGWLGRLYTPAL